MASVVYVVYDVMITLKFKIAYHHNIVSITSLILISCYNGGSACCDVEPVSFAATFVIYFITPHICIM